MRLIARGVIFIAAFAAMGMLFAAGPAAAADKQTLTGVVSDSMCGAQHMEPDAVKCTRTCAARGAKYILVVGEKTYSLNTSDKALLDVLNQQAGKNVAVTGIVNGIAVDVSSVVPAK